MNDTGRLGRHRHPVLSILLFAMGLGLGFAIGALLAAMTSPSVGEDTRRELGDLLLGNDRADRTVESAGHMPLGLLGRLQVRFRLARSEAAIERSRRQNELERQLAEAQRTGRVGA
jgi:hypothetical protein